MSTQSLALTAAGLKNITTEAANNEFKFIFDQQEISMENIFADFISPKVSKIHKSDPTINSIYFLNNIKGINITKDTISKIKLLSIGESVDINEEESFQMKIISIFLENEELFLKLDYLFPSYIKKTNIDIYLSNLTILSQISPMYNFFNYSTIIDYMSSHFYLIDKSKLKQLPFEIIKAIIFNSNLRLESEDSLLDFINELFENSDDTFDITSFYETVEFTNLSDNKFHDFFKKFDYSTMSRPLWLKLCDCFLRKKEDENLNCFRYVPKGNTIEVDPYDPNSMNGIIDFLTKKSGGNVCENKTVVVTSSSLDDDMFDAKYAVDVHCKYNYFCSCNLADSWIKYDFVKRKVRPTNYTIRSRNEYDFDHPINWVIEGSNTGSDSDWTVLDKREDEQCLIGLKKIKTFEIKEKCGSFRYLRLRQTGCNSSGRNFLVFSALEFYGILDE